MNQQEIQAIRDDYNFYYQQYCRILNAMPERSRKAEARRKARNEVKRKHGSNALKYI